MKGNRPLLLESDSEDVKALLRSAHLDEPPDGAKRRVLLGAGVGIAVAVTTATSASVASHATGTALGGSSAIGSGSAGTTTALVSAGKLGAVAVGKWVVLAAVVGAGAVGAARQVRSMRPPPSIVKTTTAMPSEPLAPRPDVATERAAAEPGPVDEPTPALAPRAGRPLKALPPTSDISGEIAAIEAARRAFDRGSSREGLAAIDRYFEDYPRGTLSPEATVLRIEGLVSVGERSRARAIGEAFLRAHPKSPHAQRVRSLIAPANP